MNNSAARIIVVCCIVLAGFSALTLNSCRDKTITQWDTLVVHDTIHCPDSALWVSRSTNTTEDLVIGAFKGGAGFVGGTHGVMLQTNDAGNTWQSASSAPVFNSSYGPGAVYGLSFADSLSLFAAGDQRMIVQSMDGGQSWNSMNTLAVPTTDLIRSIRFVTSGIGFIGTSDAYAAPSGSICKTTDGGQSWIPTFTTHGGIYNIDFLGSNGVAQGRFGVNYWTNDNGTSWNPGSSDVPNAVIYRSAFTNPSTAFAVAMENESLGYILKSTDGGHNWHTIKSVPFGLQGISFNGNNTVTAVGYGGIVYESTDGGSTWNQEKAGNYRWIDIRYINSTRAIVVGQNGRIYTRDLQH